MRRIKIFGAPSSAGALYKGTELGAQTIRAEGLSECLRNKGYMVEDVGDLYASEELIRHNIGPIRNWPTPRLIWEEIERKANHLFEEDSFSVILGGDCSIVVGSFTAFRKVYGETAHLLVVDGHVDVISPNSEHCVGAAAMGLWFLTQENPFWNARPVEPASITIIGPHTLPNQDHSEMTVVPLENCSLKAYQHYLATLPPDAKVFVHFDVDVLVDQVMPAAYSPSEYGLTHQQASELFQVILSDPRVKAIEITEYCGDKDTNKESARVIIELLSLLK